MVALQVDCENPAFLNLSNFEIKCWQKLSVQLNLIAFKSNYNYKIRAIFTFTFGEDTNRELYILRRERLRVRDFLDSK